MAGSSPAGVGMVAGSGMLSCNVCVQASRTKPDRLMDLEGIMSISNTDCSRISPWHSSLESGAVKEKYDYCIYFLV